MPFSCHGFSFRSHPLVIFCVRFVLYLAANMIRDRLREMLLLLMAALETVGGFRLGYLANISKWRATEDLLFSNLCDLSGASIMQNRTKEQSTVFYSHSRRQNVAAQIANNFHTKILNQFLEMGVAVGFGRCLSSELVVVFMAKDGNCWLADGWRAKKMAFSFPSFVSLSSDTTHNQSNQPFRDDDDDYTSTLCSSSLKRGAE